MAATRGCVLGTRGGNEEGLFSDSCGSRESSVIHVWTTLFRGRKYNFLFFSVNAYNVYSL